MLVTILVLFPIIFLSTNIIKNRQLINKSDLILVYESRGNGGFGDSDTFAYAIGKDYCKQFDLGIDIYGRYLKKFLPKSAVEIKEIKDTGYNVAFNTSWEDNSATIYKNNQEICKVNNKSHYFNINFERAFYIKH